jgi:hypothetical protein
MIASAALIRVGFRAEIALSNSVHERSLVHMSDSIGSATQVQAMVGTQSPSLAQLVTARDSAPESQTNPVPTEKVHLSGEGRSTFDDGAKSIAQKAQEAAQANLNPVKQIVKQTTEQAQPAPKSIHVVA